MPWSRLRARGSGSSGVYASGARLAAWRGATCGPPRTPGPPPDPERASFAEPLGLSLPTVPEPVPPPTFDAVSPDASLSDAALPDGGWPERSSSAVLGGDPDCDEEDCSLGLDRSSAGGSEDGLGEGGLEGDGLCGGGAGGGCGHPVPKSRTPTSSIQVAVWTCSMTITHLLAHSETGTDTGHPGSRRVAWSKSVAGIGHCASSVKRLCEPASERSGAAGREFPRSVFCPGGNRETNSCLYHSETLRRSIPRARSRSEE